VGAPCGTPLHPFNNIIDGASFFSMATFIPLCPTVHFSVGEIPEQLLFFSF
jgi:hypothetical protein